MKSRFAFAILVFCLTSSHSWADNFLPTSGSQSWIVDSNWDTTLHPDSPGATAVLPAPTGDLSINLNDEISIGALTVNKSATLNQVANVTLTGTATNRLVFDGGGSLVNSIGSGTGLTTIAAPVVLNSTLTVNQADNSALQFTQDISGTGGLNLNNTSSTDGTVTFVMGGANTYSGNTILLGKTGNSNQNYLLVRLDNAASLSPNTSITLSNAVIFALNAGDFTVPLGSTGTPGTFHNGVVTTPPAAPQDAVAAKATGWAAFGADRSVNIGGNATPSTVFWGTGSGPSDALNQGIMVLGHATADKTITFKNPITLNGGTSNTSARTFQINNGAAAIDAIISGALTTAATAKSDAEFDGDGVVSLTAVNTYASAVQASPVRTGGTTINGPVVRLEIAGALTSNGNVFLTGSGILGLGAGNDTFTRPLLTSTSLTGQIQFTGAGGFAAFGGTKTVNLGGSLVPSTVTWATGSFVPTGKNLVFSDITADGKLDFQNPINLGTTAATAPRIVNVADGTGAIDAVLSGGLSQSGTASFQKNGDGTLQLTAASSYTGTTIINGGVLRFDHASALGVGPLTLKNSGVVGLGLGNDSFTRSLGTANGQIAWTDNAAGGFAAYGGTKTVLLNNDAVNSLVWGTTAGFLPSSLILSDSGADATLDFQNKVDLGGTVRTINTKNGTAAVDARLSGVISDISPNPALGGIKKTNSGTLELSNANTYAGTTEINNGVLLLTNSQSIPGGIQAASTGGNISFTSTSTNIGSIGLGQGDFTRGLGTGPGQIQFTGHGGWAAYSTIRVVNLGGASATVTWDAGGFVPAVVASVPATAGILKLGATAADATVDFQNPIDLNGGARTVNTPSGLAALMGTLSGVISSTSAGGGLIKTGGGTLAVTAANTYDAGTSILGGRLNVNNTTGSGTGSGAVTVTSGTLGGTGAISGAVTVSTGATIAPGTSIESLDTGALTISGGTFAAELDSSVSPSVGADRLNVSGSLSIAGGSKLTLTDLAAVSTALATGTKFTLIGYTGSWDSGVFNDALNNLIADDTNVTVGANTFTINYNDIAGGSNFVAGSFNHYVTLSIPGLAGDYNGDGKVDAADYVLWRKDPANHGGNPAGYNTWRGNFGNPPGSGSGVGLGGAGAVPEPAALVLLWFVVPLIGSRRFALVLH
jgi:autotransporter-associated beta strand protein